MCLGCYMKFSIVDGDKYVKEVNAEYIQKSLNVSKLFLSVNLDENLIDECILGILSDPIHKNYRINEVYENKNDIEELTWFYSSLRMCIIGLILFNTVGEKKSRKWFKDELAIKVMETVMNEFNQKPEKHTIDAFSYFECIRGDSIDKKYFNLQNLVYA